MAVPRQGFAARFVSAASPHVILGGRALARPPFLPCPLRGRRPKAVADRPPTGRCGSKDTPQERCEGFGSPFCGARPNELWRRLHFIRNSCRPGRAHSSFTTRLLRCQTLCYANAPFNNCTGAFVPSVIQIQLRVGPLCPLWGSLVMLTVCGWLCYGARHPELGIVLSLCCRCGG